MKPIPEMRWRKTKWAISNYLKTILMVEKW